MREAQYYIDDGNKVLENFFGIYSKRTSCAFCESSEQLEFIINDPKRQDGFYDLKLEAAYATDMASLFHEYHGHGLFFEHSIMGRNIKAIMHRRCSVDFESVYNNTLLFAEGNAIWTSIFLMNKLGKDNELAAYIKSLPSRYVALPLDNMQVSYEWVYNHLKMYELNNGVYNLWWGLFGFPRVYTKSVLDNLINDIFGNRSNILMAVLFGSRKKYSDVDLFVVSDNPNEIKNVDNKLGVVDVGLYNTEEFKYKLNLFDVGVTEALLTGDFICGNYDAYQQCKNWLSVNKPSVHAIRYLRESSQILREYAYHFKKKNDEIRYLENLGYSISYDLFARRYEKGGKVADYGSVANNKLNEIRQRLHDLKRKMLTFSFLPENV